MTQLDRELNLVNRGLGGSLHVYPSCSFPLTKPFFSHYTCMLRCDALPFCSYIYGYCDLHALLVSEACSTPHVEQGHNLAVSRTIFTKWIN